MARTPVKQLIKHNPPHAYGDCHRAAIAYVLGLRAEDVPHFMDGTVGLGPAPSAHEAVDLWLGRRGMRTIEVVYDGATRVRDLLVTISHTNARSPSLHYLLGGRSEIGSNHTVVCSGAKIVCDPSGNGIVGPCDDGYYWVTFFGHLKGF